MFNDLCLTIKLKANLLYTISFVFHISYYINLFSHFYERFVVNCIWLEKFSQNRNVSAQLKKEAIKKMVIDLQICLNMYLHITIIYTSYHIPFSQIFSIRSYLASLFWQTRSNINYIKICNKKCNLPVCVRIWPVSWPLLLNAASQYWHEYFLGRIFFICLAAASCLWTISIASSTNGT